MIVIAFAALILLASGLVGARNYSQPSQDVRELAQGAPIEREIAGGETHAYRIRLAARQFVRISVSQRDVDVAVRVLSTDGRTVAEVNGPGSLKVSFVTESMGNYGLEVRARKKDAARGRYELSIEELRAATPQDESGIAAERALAEGDRLRAQRNAESLRNALAKYEEALSLYQSAGNGQGRAITLVGIGKVYIRLGQGQKALGYLIEALSLSQSLNDIDVESQVSLSLGVVYSSLGEPHKALDCLNRALKLFRDRGDRGNEIGTLDSIGLAHSELGEYQKALDYYNQVLSLIRASGQREAEASPASRFREVSVLHNIGYAYASLGDYREALEYMGQVLALNRAAKYPYGEAYALHNIGWVHALSGELQKALEYLGQSVAVGRTIGDQRLHPGTLGMMGVVYSDLNEPQKALELLGQALALCQKLGIRQVEATTLNQIGSVYAKLGDQQKALQYFTQALSLSRAIGLRPLEATALKGLAQAHYDGGDINEAHAKMDAALNIIESVRTEVASRQLRTSYLASNKSYYELHIDVLMRQHKINPSAGHNAMALQASERSRARSLLESLTEARAEIKQGVDPELLERERTLQQQLNAKAARLTELLSGKHSPEQLDAARKEVDALITRYQEVQAQIRAASPRYAALTQPVPLSLKEIQQQVLDDETLMLEYALGEERSFLWAVTSRSIASFELPKRNEIETAARRVYELLSISPTRQRKRESELAAAELARMLLGPVADQLEKKRLLIVADGALQYVPFGALPKPESGRAGERESGRMGAKTNPQSFMPLIIDHEIVSLPSASVLAALRRELAGRQHANRLVAVLADPVLRSDDRRVGQGKIKPGKEPGEQVALANDFLRSARETGVTSFERLVFTRQEAEAILTLAQDGKNLKALDFDASRATATSPELAQYRFVHFATHGLINSQHPELSGLVLSLVDEDGRPQDGFLRAHDIYNLKFGADLVVLSACQTALGKQIKGEGLVGLVRGFMYAGAPRVVASLWDVRDEATSELMKRFYQKMLKEGLRPAAALRAAQVSMRKEPRWTAPYYWAGFVIQGEWN